MTLAQRHLVFLSYAREDVAFARELREWLLTAGNQPWMDLYDIPAGARWPDETDKGLASSDFVVGILDYVRMSALNIDNALWKRENRRRGLTSGRD